MFCEGFYNPFKKNIGENLNFNKNSVNELDYKNLIIKYLYNCIEVL